MANKILEAPVGVTKTAIRTAERTGRLAFRFGEPMTRSRGVSTEVRERQAILRRFEDRFVIASNLLRLDGSERRVKERVASTADAMVNGGLVDEYMAVELRPVLPTDAIRDPAMNARRESVLELLRQRFAYDYDVTAIPNTHPIMPAEHEDTPPSEFETWAAISTELDGFTHQLGETTHQSRLAMLAVTSPAYAEMYFGTQKEELLVLKHVGVLPQDNLLVGIS